MPRTIRIPLVNPGPKRRRTVKRNPAFIGPTAMAYALPRLANRLPSFAMPLGYEDTMALVRPLPARKAAGAKRKAAAKKRKVRTNPSQKEPKMATPRRNKKGRFVKATRKATIKRKVRAAAPKRRRKTTARKSTLTTFGVHRPNIVRTASGWRAKNRKSVLIGKRINPSRRRRRNPSLATSVKGAFNKQMLLAAAGTLLGFIGGRFLGKKVQEMLVDKAPAMAKYSGVIQIVVGGVLAAKAKKPLVKSIAVGVAASGIESVFAAVAPEAYARLAGEDLVPVGAQLPWEGEELVTVGAQLPWEGDDQDDDY